MTNPTSTPPRGPTGSASQPDLLPVPQHDSGSAARGPAAKSTSAAVVKSATKPTTRKPKSAGDAEKAPPARRPAAKISTGSSAAPTTTRKPPVDAQAAKAPTAKAPAAKTPATKAPAASTPTAKAPADKTPAAKAPPAKPAKTPAAKVLAATAPAATAPTAQDRPTLVAVDSGTAESTAGALPAKPVPDISSLPAKSVSAVLSLVRDSPAPERNEDWMELWGAGFDGYLQAFDATVGYLLAVQRQTSGLAVDFVVAQSENVRDFALACSGISRELWN